MASQVSLPNHSVTSMCVVDEENVYRISINGVKVMEKADEELGFFLRKKFSLFTQMNCFTLLATLKVSRFGQCLSEAFCHASVVCVCVCVCVCVRVLAEKQWLVQFAESRDHVTRDLFAP